MGEQAMKERLSILKELFISGTKYPPEEDMAHYNDCSGCARCEMMMEFFSHCYCCDVVIDKQYLYYDHPAGDYYCKDCIGSMPDDNSNDFVLCGHCFKRDVREEMFRYHSNFDTTWTCKMCVYDSIINSRAEILDL